MTNIDGFERKNGESWWSVERTNPSSKEPSIENDIDPLADLFDATLLSDPRFIAVCCIVVLAQILTGIVIFRNSKETPSSGIESERIKDKIVDSNVQNAKKAKKKN